MKEFFKIIFFVFLLAAAGCGKTTVTQTFDAPMTVRNKGTFGPKGEFTFSLDRNGTFIIDGRSGYAWERSDSYRDSAFIRSTKPLPPTYKITAVVGGIDFGLEKIEGLPQDADYPEGPANENGCYLLTITDEVPNAPHANIWWHQHRKLVIDVDNNAFGSGMPNPVFMVYFDKNNALNAYNGSRNAWQSEWTDAVKYEKDAFYKVEVERTKTEFIMRISTESGKLLKEGHVGLDHIWHSEKYYEDYFVIGDPHANYYQGSMKIKQLTLQY